MCEIVKFCFQIFKRNSLINIKWKIPYYANRFALVQPILKDRGVVSRILFSFLFSFVLFFNLAEVTSVFSQRVFFSQAFFVGKGNQLGQPIKASCVSLLRAHIYCLVMYVYANFSICLWCWIFNLINIFPMSLNFCQADDHIFGMVLMNDWSGKKLFIKNLYFIILLQVTLPVFNEYFWTMYNRLQLEISKSGSMCP